MAVSELLNDPFWNKKVDRMARVVDMDDDGVISRRDYEIICERYVRFSGASETKIKAVRASVDRILEDMGLEDETKSLSYDEYKKGVAHMVTQPIRDEFLLSLFDNIDVDDNGTLSLSEWKAHYQCWGVDPKYAEVSFLAMDEDRDKKVTRAEFLAFVGEFYGSTKDTMNSVTLCGPLDGPVKRS